MSWQERRAGKAVTRNCETIRGSHRLSTARRQFSPEYRRLFGAPPASDITKLKVHGDMGAYIVPARAGTALAM